AFLTEADFFVHPERAGIVLVNVQPDPIQVHRLESIADDQPGRLSTVALAPGGLVAQDNAERRTAVARLNVVEPGRADEPVAVAKDNARGQVLLAGDHMF